MNTEDIILTNMNYICSEEEDTESGIYANNVLNAFMYNDELYYFVPFSILLILNNIKRS